MSESTNFVENSVEGQPEQDWGLVVLGQLALLPNLATAREKFDVYVRIASIQVEQLGDFAGAIDSYNQALEYDSEDIEALNAVIDLHLELGEAQEALDRLHEICSVDDDPVRLSQYYAVIAQIYRDELDDPQSAIDFLELTLDANFHHIPAFEAIVEIFTEQHAVKDLVQAYQDMINRTNELTAMLHSRVEDLQEHGLASPSLDEDSAPSLDDVELAAEVTRPEQQQPSHFETTVALAEIDDLCSNAEFEAAVRKLDGVLNEAITKSDRFTLLCRIANIQRAHLDDNMSAMARYQEALELRENSRPVLKALFELNVELEEYNTAIGLLTRLISWEDERPKLAEYHFQLAELYREQMQQSTLAITHYNLVLDNNRDRLKAFEYIDRILTKASDWHGLEANYQAMIERIIARPELMDLLFTLYRNLGEIYRTRLKDLARAVGAFEAATSLRPGDIETKKIICQLLALQAGADPSLVDKTLAHHRSLIALDPDGYDAYKTIAQLYFKLKRYDAAWCVCSVLQGFNQADNNQRNFFFEHSLDRLRESGTPMTQAALQTCYPPRLDVDFADILATLSGVIRDKMASSVRGYVRKKQRLNASKHLMLHDVATKVFSYFTVPQPEFYVAEAKGSIAVPFTSTPIIILDPQLEGGDPRHIAFLLGFKALYFLPHFSLVLKGEKGLLTQCLIVSLCWSIPERKLPDNDELKLVHGLVDRLSPTLQQQLRAAVGRLVDAGGKIHLNVWLAETERLAVRLGFIATGGHLPATLKAIANYDPLHYISPQDVERDLSSFAISDEYFAIRETLGFDIES